MIIIPAIDIYENKIVRLKEGDFSQVSYYPQTPVEQALVFEENGFDYLHVVDLSGSKTGNISVIKTIREIKSSTRLTIEFGGGVRNKNNVKELLTAGADRIIIGSMSINNKKEFEGILSAHGAEKVIVAADVKNEMIAVKGWTEQTSLSIYEHIDYCLSLGVNTCLCTDISKDGLLTGTNTALYKKILLKFPELHLIASGGIKDIEDVIGVRNINVYGVVIGRAIYENRIDLRELAKIGQ